MRYLFGHGGEEGWDPFAMSVTAAEDWGFVASISTLIWCIDLKMLKSGRIFAFLKVPLVQDIVRTRI